MTNIEITIKKIDGSQETVLTDGFLLLYLESGKVKMKGQVELAALAPLLAKAVLEKMSR